MLRQRHLPLLRGALQFFGEELLPHGPEVVQPYLDEEIDGEFNSSELQELQRFLSQVEVRYAVLDEADHERVQPQLSDAPDEIAAPTDHLAVVLVPIRLGRRREPDRVP